MNLRTPVFETGAPTRWPPAFVAAFSGICASTVTLTLSSASQSRIDRDAAVNGEIGTGRVGMLARCRYE